MKYLNDNDDTSIVSYTTMNAMLSDLCDIKQKDSNTSEISKPIRKVTNYVFEIKNNPGMKKSTFLNIFFIICLGNFTPGIQSLDHYGPP